MRPRRRSRDRGRPAGSIRHPAVEAHGALERHQRPAVRLYVSHARLARAASCSPTPATTWTPPSAAARRHPWPLQSGRATRTRRAVTPASTSAWVHGPVRPVCRHGSRVTTAVQPRARSPASARATTSACGVPAPRWWPRPTTVPSGSTITHPTRGIRRSLDVRAQGELDGRPHVALPGHRRVLRVIAHGPSLPPRRLASSQGAGLARYPVPLPTGPRTGDVSAPSRALQRIACAPRASWRPRAAARSARSMRELVLHRLERVHRCDREVVVPVAPVVVQLGRDRPTVTMDEHEGLGGSLPGHRRVAEVHEHVVQRIRVRSRPRCGPPTGGGCDRRRGPGSSGIGGRPAWLPPSCCPPATHHRRR